MSKTIFLKVWELGDLGVTVIERSFRVEDCAISRVITDEKGPYRPIIHDYKAGKSFAIVGELTDEKWEELKRIFTE